MEIMHSEIKKLTHDEISVKRSTLETIDVASKIPLCCLLDSIRSTYNVGSIFRTSDGAMIEKLYLTGYTPHPPKKRNIKDGTRFNRKRFLGIH